MATKSIKETLFGAEDNSAAKMGQESLGRFQRIAARMYHTPQLSARERAMPSLAQVGRQISEQINGSYRTYFFITVLRIDMLYITLIQTILGIYNALIRPLMGIAYDKTRTRWGKARPYTALAPVLYYAGTALLFCGRLFFDNDITDDPRKIVFVFVMLMVRDTVSLIYKIPTDNYTSLMSPNPADRMSVGLWQEYTKRWSGDFISFLVVPLLDAARSGLLKTSLGSIFAGFGIVSAFFGVGGNILMAANCRERIILQPKPAATRKALFYILKNKYAMREFVAGFVTSWWSKGGYSWDVVTQMEIMGGFLPATLFGIPKHITNFISIALVEPFKKLFGGSYKKTIIFMRSWDLLFGILPSFIGFSPNIIGSWWKLGVMHCAFEVLRVSNDAPSNVLESEIGREIGDYTEYVTGERPDGSIGLLTNLASKLMDPLQALMTILVFKWSGYDPNIGANKRWNQGIVRENSTMYSKAYFLYQFSNIPNFIARIIVLIMYDLDGKKKADMYAALNERRALVAADDTASEIEAMMGMMEKEAATAG